MASNNCPQCGAPTASGAANCKYCGEPLAIVTPVAPPVQGSYPVMQNGQMGQVGYAPPQIPFVSASVDPNWPVRNKIAAGILAIFFGGLGIHKFYLAKPGLGILYLIFCWTWIPEILGVVEGIVYLTQSDYDFQMKNRVRLG